jgi:hypothetical protein
MLMRRTVLNAAFLALHRFIGARGECSETLTETCLSAADDNVLLQSRAQVTRAEASETDHELCSLTDLPHSDASVKSFTDFDHGSSYEGLYVNKDAKFAFCLIEKNACSAWSTIFQRMETGNLDWNSASYGIAQSSFSSEDAAHVFSDTSASRAVFIRDPLERFLSAFLDKCTSGSCANSFCFMRSADQSGSPIAFSAAVDWLKDKDGNSLGDGHWSSQASHCELSSRLHEYTVLGIMKPSTLAPNAACLMERANLSSVNVKSSSDASGFWETPDEKQNETENVEYLKSFYTKEAAEAVYNAFKDDYELFGIPRPSWIGDANGKFFTEPSLCTTALLLGAGMKSGHKSQSDNGLFDDDDVPSLARRAGFSI